MTTASGRHFGGVVGRSRLRAGDEESPMQAELLFTMALGLVPPWKVERTAFDQAKRRLDLWLGFEKGSRFPCPECGAACPAHDTAEKEWRHLNFFEHEAFLHARQPRVKCDKHGVLQVTVPWARPGSGFTLLFEAFVLALVQNGMPVAAVARMVGEHDTRLWRLLMAYVSRGMERLDLSGVTKVALDETSQARGHEYLTVFVDPETPRAMAVAEGRKAETVGAFAEFLAEHGGDPQKITEVSLDMSPAYIKGVTETFPSARMTFDKFHVVSLLTSAVDETRRDEQNAMAKGEKRVLKDSRFLFLRNAADLTEAQRERFGRVAEMARRTARAWKHKEQLRELYSLAGTDEARAYLDRWVTGAVRSRLPAVVRAARTIREHADGILRWFSSRLTNALLEGYSSLIQAAKAVARGYRNRAYMATIIMLKLGKLDLRWRGPRHALPI